MSVIVLTPNVTGYDGISHLARLIVRACEPSAVIALHEPARLARFEHVPVFGCGGRTGRFVSMALQHAARSDSTTTVVTVHLHLAPGAVAFAARGAVTLTMVCGIEAWRPLGWSQRAALQHSDRLVSISRHSAKRFRAANRGLAQLPIDICHPGVELVRAVRAPLPVQPSALIVGRMASNERYKGHDMLLDIWSDVRAQVPHAQLHIVGDGDDRRRLQDKARGLGLAEHVVFHGAMDAVALNDAYQSCSAFVMPSRDEGFGLVFLEAMRARRACIGAHGSASEIIDHGRTGLLVDPADPNDLTTALVTILRDRTVAASMGDWGYQRFLDQFTETRFRERFGLLLPRAMRAASA